MDPISEASELASQGLFRSAAVRLDCLVQGRLSTPAALLRASLCEATGDYQQAQDLASRVLRSRLLTDRDQSLAEFVLSRVAAATGNRRSETESLQRSLAAAERSADLERIGWARIRLLALMDPSSIDACTPAIQRARQTVSEAGIPSLSSALHLVVADLDGMRGRLARSQRHVLLAQSILDRYPNAWLRGWSENTRLALALLQCDISAAVEHGTLALALGQESGSAVVIRHAYANLGRLYYTTGDFELATSHLERALSMAKAGSEAAHAIIDTMARVLLAEGRFEEGEILTRWVEGVDRDEVCGSGYVCRHTLLTRADALRRLRRSAESQRCYRRALELARSANDVLLESAVLSSSGSEDYIRRVGELGQLTDFTPEQVISYERSTMYHLLYAGDELPARGHFFRALSIARALKNQPAESELLRAWSELSPSPAPSPLTAPPSAPTLQDFASLLLHAGRPELLATGLLTVLRATTDVLGARAIARAADGTEHVLGTCGAPVDPHLARTFHLGTARNCAIDVLVQAPPDVEPQATLNSLGFIIAATQELERGRIEREERQTLWPADELPAVGDDSVVAGKMRDVMLYARKVAQAHVTVLITGESGTGKEVLARAIHRYSPRSKKPFIPFNCTAVPRELIESHLFGFKRGAFTGADRDNQGLIRAAKDGTLFLDEIGELSLDLQPKLLRFLESSEIHPLGETSPFCVNVRIVAATNADLQTLVADGKFREDLYYRLNVIPIALPALRERREEIAPLAQHFALKWSHELGKGCMRVADDLMEHLVLYTWPGNIRQLSNEIHRMVAFADPGSPLTVDHLPKALREETELLKRRASGLEMAVSLTDRLDHAVATLEREMIKVALRTTNGKVDPAAKSLGISRKGLYLKRQRFGL